MNRTSIQKRRSRRTDGYTLVDVMAVTAILGVLLGLGVNQYNKYIARSRRPETVMSFRAIAAQQREYLLTHGKYAATFEQLGFNIEGGKRVSPTEIQGFRYNYRILQDDGPRSWYVIATGNIDGDEFLDIIAASNPR